MQDLISSFERLAVIARGIVQSSDGQTVITDAYGGDTDPLEVCRLMLMDMASLQSLQRVLLGSFDTISTTIKNEADSSGSTIS